jgi:hypothetical protein
VCGLGYLENTLGPVLREICDEKANCEVDPTRLDKNDDVKLHWKRLIGYANALWSSIDKSRTSIPRYLPWMVWVNGSELRMVFHHLQRTVLARFNEAREDKFTIVRYTSVSGFLFLRLFCPAILNPKLFGITKGTFDMKPTTNSFQNSPTARRPEH